jgi:hypothetical protein
VPGSFRRLDFDGETCDHYCVRGRWIVAALGTAIVALPWGFAVHKLVSPRPVKVDGLSSSLVWGDRVFASPRAIGGWLSARGYRYRPWASLHPQAVAILAHKPFRPPVLAGAAPTTISTPASTAGSGLVSELKVAVEILLLALAIAILAVSAAPAVLLSRGPPRLSYTLQANRAYFATGAIAILLGYAVQTLN